MELKLEDKDPTMMEIVLLIELYGIEIRRSRRNRREQVRLLIELYGIEIGVLTCFARPVSLLIELYGIEIFFGQF